MTRQAYALFLTLLCLGLVGITLTLARTTDIVHAQQTENQTVAALRAENAKLQLWLNDTSKALDEQALKANRLQQENEELAAKVQWQKELRKL